MLSNNPSILPALSIVTSMITPAILILAAGSLVSSTLVRMGRIVDQIRRLVARGDELRRRGNHAGVRVLDEQLSLLLRRHDLVRRALLAYYVAISLFLLSSIAIGITHLLLTHLVWVGPAIVMLGAIFLFVGSAALVVEVNLSSGTVRREVERFQSGTVDPSER